MNLTDLLKTLRYHPIVASAQASMGSPLEDPEILLRLAEASVSQGARVIRAQGLGPIWLMKQELNAPIIGLIKADYRDSAVYITPSRKEVEELLQTGCEVIALDGTRRERPNGDDLSHLIRLIHDQERLAMADCDSLDSARYALECGADLIGTTLAGYTHESRPMSGPDFDLLRDLCHELNVPIIAEGRYQEPWQAQAALNIGAQAVVIGGALNDPVKQTARFVGAVHPVNQKVGAVDLGGTWLRFAVADERGELSAVEKTSGPRSHAERREWIHERLIKHQITHLGVSAGGVIDPRTATVVSAKTFIHDYVGGSFVFDNVVTHALNDGLATAWGHACLPEYAGKRVAVLAFGTGVGAGVIESGNLLMSRNGWPPSLNDLDFSENETVEDVLGGLALSKNPGTMLQGRAIAAAKRAIEVADIFWIADEIVVCGGVGLTPWMTSGLAGLNLRHARLSFSPLGENAGLIGAASLVQRAPLGVFR